MGGTTKHRRHKKYVGRRRRNYGVPDVGCVTCFSRRHVERIMHVCLRLLLGGRNAWRATQLDLTFLVFMSLILCTKLVYIFLAKAPIPQHSAHSPLKATYFFGIRISSNISVGVRGNRPECAIPPPLHFAEFVFRTSSKT